MTHLWIVLQRKSFFFLSSTPSICSKQVRQHCRFPGFLGGLSILNPKSSAIACCVYFCKPFEKIRGLFNCGWIKDRTNFHRYINASVGRHWQVQYQRYKKSQQWSTLQILVWQFPCQSSFLRWYCRITSWKLLLSLVTPKMGLEVESTNTLAFSWWLCVHNVSCNVIEPSSLSQITVLIFPAV